MVLIEQTASYQIWHDAATNEYVVYGAFRDPKWCPSIGMAREVAANA